MAIHRKNTAIKIAVIGGGTGSFTLLSGLKHETEHIAALVNMADDGGSTGQLRDEHGVLPPGDVRQCLVALSKVGATRDLFDYRFEEGVLKGHAFGNIFLTALEKMTGDFAAGVELASEVLDIVGVVEPITLSNVTLAMKDGRRTVRGEYQISQMDFRSNTLPKLWLEPKAEANPRAIAAIMQADMVIVAPGNLYGSLAPALIVPGVGQALRKSKAFTVYVCNLVTKPGQTDGFQVHDFVSEVERLAGGPFLDAVLFNTGVPSADLLEKYAHDGELSVTWDEKVLRKARYIAVGADLLSSKVWSSKGTSDPIASTRTLIRHDTRVLAKSIIDLYKYARK